MKRTFFADLIAYFFIALFLYTGIIKLTGIHLFQQQLSSSPLMASMSGIISWALPIGEILLAIVLFIPRWRLRGLYLALTLMSVFTLYVIIMLIIDDQLSCSCGGIIENLSPKQHILFNGSCVILGLLAILITRRQQPPFRFKWVTGSSVFLLLIVIGWLLFTAFAAPPVERTGLEGRTIPSFSLQLPDSTTQLNTSDFPAGKPFIVIGFSPWCVHCQALTVDITQHIKDFKNIRIYYVTPDNFKGMMAFYRFYKLSNYPNITMGRDTQNFFFGYFKTSSTPYIAIFDSKKRLKTVMANGSSAVRLAQMIED